MKLLVLGASGATGSWLTRLSAQAGHEVTALARPNARFDVPPNVRVVRGDVLDAATLATALMVRVQWRRVSGFAVRERCHGRACTRRLTS